MVSGVVVSWYIIKYTSCLVLPTNTVSLSSGKSEAGNFFFVDHTLTFVVPTIVRTHSPEPPPNGMVYLAEWQKQQNHCL